MLGILPVVAVFLGQIPGSAPSELVRQLGSARFAEREAAAAALEAMGADALPALRAASESKDSEIRTRAVALVAKIEWRALSRASPIRLDVADCPLDAVLEGFGFPSPSRMAWHPGTPEAVRQRRVTIREPGPLPFWSAIDRLCRAGELHYIPGSPGGPGSHHDPEFRLFLASGQMICPRADSGPLRLEIVAIYHSRHVNLIPNDPRELPSRGGIPPRFGERREEFYAVLRILAEPRMLINHVGDALISDAVDDRGQSLLPGPAPYIYSYGIRHTTSQACTEYFVHLKHPERPGKVIQRLKLTIPVAVVTLQPDRLEIPLAGAVGKTFQHGKTSIEILAVGRDPAGHQMVRLKLRTEEVVPERLTLDRTGKLEPVASQPAPPEVTPNVIQVLDQQGRQFPWFHGNNHTDGPEVTAELMLHPEGGIAIPVRAGRGIVPGEDRRTAVPAVIYHSELARGVIPATFAFTDVPLP
jgi:hypothetical protein